MKCFVIFLSLLLPLLSFGQTEYYVDQDEVMSEQDLRDLGLLTGQEVDLETGQLAPLPGGSINSNIFNNFDSGNYEIAPRVVVFDYNTRHFQAFGDNENMRSVKFGINCHQDEGLTKLNGTSIVPWDAANNDSGAYLPDSPHNYWDSPTGDPEFDDKRPTWKIDLRPKAGCDIDTTFLGQQEVWIKLARPFDSLGEAAIHIGVPRGRGVHWITNMRDGTYNFEMSCTPPKNMVNDDPGWFDWFATLLNGTDLNQYAYITTCSLFDDDYMKISNSTFHFYITDAVPLRRHFQARSGAMLPRF